jgi:hypothetical protein
VAEFLECSGEKHAKGFEGRQEEGKGESDGGVVLAMVSS